MTEKSYAELLYQPGDPELVADRDVTVKKLHECNHIHPLDCGARQAAIRGLLGKAETTVLWSSPSFAPTDITPRWAITSSSMSTTSSWTAEK